MAKQDLPASGPDVGLETEGTAEVDAAGDQSTASEPSDTQPEDAGTQGTDTPDTDTPDTDTPDTDISDADVSDADTVDAQTAEVETAEAEIREVAIAKLVAGGDGLGFLEGKPIFVPRSAPGDVLEVVLTEQKKDYARGTIQRVIKPGPDRIRPRCAHYDDCGGCDLQHLEYRAQVQAKVEAAVETLRRIGGRSLPEEVRIVRGESWNYRLRTTLHQQPVESTDPTMDQLQDPASASVSGTISEPNEPTMQSGYWARHSDRLVPVRECPVLVPELEALVQHLPGSLEGQLGRRIDLAVGDRGRVTFAPATIRGTGGPVTAKVGDYSYEFDARCFFQTHRGLLADLVDAVIGSESAENSDDRMERAVELYAGVGLFTLPLAQRYGKVLAVEGDRIACRYLRTNARKNGLDNVTVVNQAVQTWLRDLPPAVDRLVVDPPRSGLSPYVRSAIKRAVVPRLTYVSCHPAALARDLASFKQYEIEEITFLDLFPQTGHIEIVVQARRSDILDDTSEDN